MRDPNFEIWVDPVEEEDWASGLRVRHRRNRGALVDWRLRVLEGVPKNEITVAIIWREVGPWIVEFDLWVVHNIPNGNW